MQNSENKFHIFKKSRLQVAGVFLLLKPIPQSINVSVKAKELEMEHVRHYINIETETDYCISVTDNGVGTKVLITIPKEVRK